MNFPTASQLGMNAAKRSPRGPGVLALLSLCGLLCLPGCAGHQLTLPVKDPHSFSRPSEIAVTHLTLLLDVDFDSRTIKGEASWRIRNPSGARELRLDTRGLTIRRVQLLAAGRTRGERRPSIRGIPVSSPRREWWPS